MSGIDGWEAGLESAEKLTVLLLPLVGGVRAGVGSKKPRGSRKRLVPAPVRGRKRPTPSAGQQQQQQAQIKLIVKKPKREPQQQQQQAACGWGAAAMAVEAQGEEKGRTQEVLEHDEEQQEEEDGKEEGEALDDAACDVCGNDESLEDDPIVACDGCDVAVHQSCYGITRLPDGDWFCAV